MDMVTTRRQRCGGYETETETLQSKRTKGDLQNVQVLQL